MKTSVAIVRDKRPSKMIETALELIEANNLIHPEDKVLIKPNYVVAKHPSTGTTTDSHVVTSLIKFVKQLEVREVVVGEGGIRGDTDKAFDVVEIRCVTERQKVKLVNVNLDSVTEVTIPNALRLHQVGIAETALNSTCIINVPTLKVHHLAVVSLSMKNLIGLILPKNIMHDRLHEKIVDLASFLKDKVKINIVDGLIGEENHEIYGSPVKMNLIIAGRDMVAVDSVATAVMGIYPNKVKYLRLAEKRGLGVFNLKEIRVVGEDIEEVTRQFRVKVKKRSKKGQIRYLFRKLVN